MWDLPGSEIESVSPALAGRFFTTELPGKPLTLLSIWNKLRKFLSFPHVWNEVGFSQCLSWLWSPSASLKDCKGEDRRPAGIPTLTCLLPKLFSFHLTCIFCLSKRVLPKKFNNYLLRSSLSFFQFKSLCFCNKHTVFPYYYFKRKTKILKFWG